MSTELKENLRAWRIFFQTAKTLNITRTSEILDIDQKTASRILNELEREIQTQLFDRKKRPLQLTEKGKEIFSQVKKLLTASDDLNQLIKADQSSLELRLSLPVNMPREGLYPLISSYKKIDPGLKIVLENDCDHRHVLDKEVDMAMLPYLPINRKGLSCFDAGYSFNMLMCSPAYIKKYGEPQNINQLKSHKLLLRQSRIYPLTSELNHGNQKLSLKGFNLNYLGDAFSCKEAAMDGEGVAVDLSLAYCKEEIKTGKLVIILPGWHRPRWDMTVVIRKEDESNKRIRDFAKWFSDCQKVAYPKRWSPFYKALGVNP